MKIKVKENRFNAETVVANYCFGTWNIGTLKGKSGEVCEVLHRRKVKVCCIQEVRWKGEGSRALQGYKLIWKGNSEGTAGVGVLVASELADRIIRVERISDRVIAVDLVIGEQIVKVVSCYAPQAGRSQIEKEEFWRQVEGVIMNTDINIYSASKTLNSHQKISGTTILLVNSSTAISVLKGVCPNIDYNIEILL